MRKPKNMVTGTAVKIKRFAGMVAQEKVPPMDKRSGRTKIWVEIVARRCSRIFQKFGNQRKYFSSRGESKISPKVAIKESWKETSKMRILGLNTTIKNPAAKRAASAS